MNLAAPAHHAAKAHLYARWVARNKIYISVVIPVHESKSLNPNFEDYSNEILQKGHELILVVDQEPYGNSNPKTIEVIERFSKNTNFGLKVHKQNFGSPGAARNWGKAEATGGWVYFWDADDAPKLNQAVLFVNELEKKSADMGIASAELIFTNKNTFFIGSNIKDIVKWPGLWRMAFKTELIKNIAFENWSWCEDQDFILKALRKSHLALSSDITIYKYFVHVPNSSTSTKSNWNSIPQFMETLKSSIDSKSGSKLDYFFFIKNLYSLRRYLAFLPWVKNVISALPLIFAVVRLSSPRISRLRRLDSRP